ncbi:hypothetical protein HCTV5_136 [Halovirus HCTV-5]|uniref:hypothetical protein n=1 Tax=Halovirus HCTV-5 TaxID=1273748 RepID=UPI00033489CF|nr:hypothetical protein M200_gp092 [Halovirus HCTV-5]AGM11742.1 hypothetical protein HCTV5_136 [Halovirus HCTV-5]
MALDDLDGIANVEFNVGGTETLTWDTQAEWDAAATREKVVTRGIGDRVADEIWLGYDPNYGPLTDATDYWTLDEDTGDFINVIGTEDMEPDTGGTTRGQNGILGSNGAEFDATGNAHTQFPDTDSYTWATGDWTWALWAYTRSSSLTRQTVLGSAEDDVSTGRTSCTWVSFADDGNIKDWTGDNWYNVTSYSTNTWYLIGQSYDSSTDTITNWVDATDHATRSSGSDDVENGNGVIAGLSCGRSFNERNVDGFISDCILWDSLLTSSEWNALYGAASDGFLQTATKSFSSSEEPDLQNLAYSLNGESISLDVIGSPGTQDEEIQTQTLDGSSSYALTWNAAHTDFRIQADLSTTDPEVTPVVDELELVN